MGALQELECHGCDVVGLVMFSIKMLWLMAVGVPFSLLWLLSTLPHYTFILVLARLNGLVFG